jgi:hypothetical protein
MESKANSLTILKRWNHPKSLLSSELHSVPTPEGAYVQVIKLPARVITGVVVRRNDGEIQVGRFPQRKAENVCCLRIVRREQASTKRLVNSSVTNREELADSQIAKMDIRGI